MSTTDAGGTPTPFDQGFPDDDTSERVHNETDLRNAIEVYRFFYPTVSAEGLMNGQREAGAEDNKSGMLMACGPRHVLFTGNSDTPYLGGNLDLKKGGAMVIEVPAGPYVGVVNDHNQRWVVDLGIAGADEGKGGKYLVLPPDHKATVVPSGYHVAQARTSKVLLAMRAIPQRGDIQGALQSLRKLKVYPLAQASSPPAYGFVDATETAVDCSCLRWEDNFQYWQKLAAIVEHEALFDEFRPMYGLLATLGIEKDEHFAPDARMTLILQGAAKLGRDQLLVEAFASDRAERIVWPDRRWEWVALRSETGDFEASWGIDIPARERWFAQAVAASPAMFRRQVGSGSLYWLGHHDASGEYLDGGAHYKLNVPAPVPASLFWSVTAYDAQTRSQVQTDQDRAALRSLVEKFAPNADGSIDLFFGPEPPAGKPASQWIKTNPGRGWFSYFRIYGPEQAAFDGSWKPGDFEIVR
jgi:hypothetical protein